MSKKKTCHIKVARSLCQNKLLGINTETGRYSWAGSLTELLGDIEHYDPKSPHFQGLPIDGLDLPILNWANAKDSEQFVKVVIG